MNDERTTSSWKNNKDTIPPAKDLALETYKSLRGEIHLHINVQYTTLGFMLVIIGTIITVAIKEKIGPHVLMVYPILAVFPALIWAANQVSIARIAIFLRDRFEPCMEPGFRWEEALFTCEERGYQSWVNRLYLWGIRGVFIGSQATLLILAINILISQGNNYKIGIPAVILSISDVIAILITGWVLICTYPKEDTVIKNLEKQPTLDNAEHPVTDDSLLYSHARQTPLINRHFKVGELNNHQNEQFISLLTESDRELQTKDLADLRTLLSSASNSEQEGLWTQALTNYITHVALPELHALKWATEKHYASLIRQATNKRDLDYFYLIGYARVISLTMMNSTYMGYSLDDLYFILTVLKLCATNTLDKEGGPKILEVGCGAGDLLIDLASFGYRNVVGIDIAPAAVRLARRKIEECHLAIEGLYCISLNDFCTIFPNARFDLIINCHVIEHLMPMQTQTFLDQLFRCLNPDGHLVVITPSKLTGPHDDTRFFSPAGSEPVGFHMREYLLSELKYLLSQAGFGRFRAMNALPYENKYWDTVSEENFQKKIQMEPFIEGLEWKLRKPLVDGLYFQALACQKLTEL